MLAVWALVDGDWSIAAGYWPWAAASIAINIAANVGYLVAVGRGPFSVAIPLLSFVPVFATLLAVPLLAQLPTPPPPSPASRSRCSCARCRTC